MRKTVLTHSWSEEGANSLPWSTVPLAQGLLQVDNNGSHLSQDLIISYPLVRWKATEVQTRRGVSYIRFARHPPVKCEHAHCFFQQRTSVGQEAEGLRVARHLEQGYPCGLIVQVTHDVALFDECLAEDEGQKHRQTFQLVYDFLFAGHQHLSRLLRQRDAEPSQNVPLLVEEHGSESHAQACLSFLRSIREKVHGLRREGSQGPGSGLRNIVLKLKQAIAKGRLVLSLFVPGRRSVLRDPPHESLGHPARQLAGDEV